MSAEPRRRGPVVRDAVLDATVTALSEHGYGFSVDEVARAAGVHKTTVYRRWETKPALVAAAVQRLADTEVAIDASGDPVRDLTALVIAVARALRSPVGTHILRGVVAAAADDPELADVARSFLDSRYEYAAGLIREAQRAQFIRADVDPVLLWRAMVNPLHMSTICGVPPSDQLARGLARLVVEGARVAPGAIPTGAHPESASERRRQLDCGMMSQ